MKTSGSFFALLLLFLAHFTLCAERLYLSHGHISRSSSSFTMQGHGYNKRQSHNTLEYGLRASFKEPAPFRDNERVQFDKQTENNNDVQKERSWNLKKPIKRFLGWLILGNKITLEEPQLKKENKSPNTSNVIEANINEWCQEQYPKIFQDPCVKRRNELCIAFEAQKAFEDDIILKEAGLLPTHLHERHEQRLIAFAQYKENTEHIYSTYSIQGASSFIRKYRLQQKTFISCNGNILQQQLHLEIVNIITKAAATDDLFAQHNLEAPFSSLIAEGITLAHEAKTNGFLSRGFAIADFCSCLNEEQYPYLNLMLKATVGVVVGAAEGAIVNPIKGIYHLATSPRESCKNISYGLYMLAYRAVQLTSEVGAFSFHVAFHGTYEGYNYKTGFKEVVDEFQAYMEEFAALPIEE